MAQQRYLNTRFWDDTYIIDLDPSEKLIFIYLLTNPLTNIAGIYELSIRRMSMDTGIEKDMILKILGRFQDAGKLLYKDGTIAIKNFIKHQKQNPKIKTGIETIKKNAPDWAVEFVEDRLSIDYDRLSHTNNNTNTNDNKNSNEETPPTSLKDKDLKDQPAQKKKEVKDFRIGRVTFPPFNNVWLTSEEVEKVQDKIRKTWDIKEISDVKVKLYRMLEKMHQWMDTESGSKKMAKRKSHYNTLITFPMDEADRPMSMERQRSYLKYGG